jgi:hypothetical protein
MLIDYMLQTNVYVTFVSMISMLGLIRVQLILTLIFRLSILSTPLSAEHKSMRRYLVGTVLSTVVISSSVNPYSS